MLRGSHFKLKATRRQSYFVIKIMISLNRLLRSLSDWIWVIEAVQGAKILVVSLQVFQLAKKKFRYTRNFDACLRNKSNVWNNSDSNMKSKGIQCWEYEGFWHIQAECANTLKKKNKSLNATWSDDDSDCSKEEEADFVAFASKFDYTSVARAGSSTVVPSGVSSDVPSGDQTLTYESSDDDELIEEALIQGYVLLHFKWIELTKLKMNYPAKLFSWIWRRIM